MRIMIKHTLKNIFSKPLRTLLLFVCIASCSFSALLCIDMSGSMGYLVKNLLTQVTGTSDIIITDELGVDEDNLDMDIPVNALLITTRQGGSIEIPEGFYNYFHSKSYTVESMDFDMAYKMRLIGDELSLNDDEAAISKKLAESYGLSVGDELVLYSDAGEAVSYKISVILSETGMANGASLALLSKEGMLKLDFDGELIYAEAYIDVLEDDEADEVVDILKERDYRADVGKIIDDGEINAMIKIITLIFLLMFAVCLLLVIFVTMSVSQRIVSERMSVVGTFRSLGLSNRFTTGFLLAETGLYGLFGGIIGCVLYKIVRSILLGGIISVDSKDASVSVDFGKTGIGAYIAVILVAIFIECICSIKEIVKASRTSIRDIIFDNKDTKYKLNKVSYTLGAIMIIVSIVLLVVTDNIAAMFISFAFIIFGISLLFPVLLCLCSGLLVKHFDKREKPVAKLAALECFARKSTVGSGVLCITAAALAIVLFIFVTSLDAIYDIKTFDADIQIQLNNDQKASMFSYIDDLEGVSETETVYKVEKKITINDYTKDVNIFGLPKEGFSLLIGIKNLPSDIDNDTFYIDKAIADKFGVKTGDEVELTFNSDSYLPIKKTLKVGGYIDSNNYDSTSNSIVISMDNYIDIFHDYPSEIYVRCDNPEEIKSKIKKYSGTVIYDVLTLDEYNATWEGKKTGMKSMLMLVIILGVALTVIGMISNQLIGFEGRKRECAVLMSTAMTRDKLSFMFILESMISSAIALIVSLPAAILAFIPFRRLLNSLAGGFNVSYDIKMYVVFLVILWVVFTLVSLFPVRSLRKMKIALQLKYE